MADDPSVSYWLRQLQQGDPAAADALWKRYFHQLVHLARQQLGGRTVPDADEEDVALSAFHAFCRGVEARRYPQLNDRDTLWRLLVTITVHKAARVFRDAGRKKRGGRTGVISADDLTSAQWFVLSKQASPEPTPEFAAQVAEQCEQLLASLESDELREIAIKKMEGYTNEEIALARSCACRTIERKLQLIRKFWEKHDERE